MTKFKSFLPPGLSILNGKKFIIPQYIEVPMNTTLEEVFLNWEKVKLNSIPGSGASNEDIKKYLNNTYIEDKVKKNIPDIHEIVSSSRTGEEYDVIRENGEWSCTCKGFSFRRNCKHITLVKLKQK